MTAKDPTNPTMHFSGITGDQVAMTSPRKHTLRHEVPDSNPVKECETPCSSLTAVHADLRAMKQEFEDDRNVREKAAAKSAKSRSKWLASAVGFAVSVLMASGGSIYATVSQAGASREKDRVLHEDVTMLLKISRGLEHDNIVTGQVLQQSAADRVELHQQQRDLETKIWELRQAMLSNQRQR